MYDPNRDRYKNLNTYDPYGSSTYGQDQYQSNYGTQGAGYDPYYQTQQTQQMQQQQYQQPYPYAYQPYPSQPPEKKSNKLIIVIIIVVVLLIVIVPVILAGVLWVMMTPLHSEESTSLVITAKSPIEKVYGWQIEITKVSGTLNPEDARFHVVDSDGSLLYSITVDDSNPSPFSKGYSTVYAMTISSTPVKDAGNNIINGDDAISEYSGCYIAYLDQDSNGRVNGGDSLYVYKDYNADGIIEVFNGYELKILSGDSMALNKKL